MKRYVVGKDNGDRIETLHRGTDLAKAQNYYGWCRHEHPDWKIKLASISSEEGMVNMEMIMDSEDKTSS